MSSKLPTLLIACGLVLWPATGLFGLAVFAIGMVWSALSLAAWLLT